MTKKLMMIAACAAAVLMGSGVAQADPAPAKPGPDPNGPKCWVINDEGHAATHALRLGVFGRDGLV